MSANRKHRIAKLVTNLTSLPIPLAVIQILIWCRLPKSDASAGIFFWYSAAIFIAPVVAVLLLILGRKSFRPSAVTFADFQLSNRQERRPAILIFLIGSICAIPIALQDQSGTLLRHAAAILCLVIALFAVTFSTPYNVSLHAAGWSATVGMSLVAAAAGNRPGFVWLTLGLLCVLLGVSTARLVCRLEGANPEEGHLPGEVFIGGTLGAVIAVTAFML